MWSRRQTNWILFHSVASTTQKEACKKKGFNPARDGGQGGRVVSKKITLEAKGI